MASAAAAEDTDAAREMDSADRLELNAGSASGTNGGTYGATNGAVVVRAGVIVESVASLLVLVLLLEVIVLGARVLDDEVLEVVVVLVVSEVVSVKGN